jgi:hypothetical protein
MGYNDPKFQIVENKPEFLFFNLHNVWVFPVKEK